MAQSNSFATAMHTKALARLSFYSNHQHTQASQPTYCFGSCIAIQEFFLAKQKPVRDIGCKFELGNPLQGAGHGSQFRKILVLARPSEVRVLQQLVMLATRATSASSDHRSRRSRRPRTGRGHDHRGWLSCHGDRNERLGNERRTLAKAARVLDTESGPCLSLCDSV